MLFFLSWCGSIANTAMSHLARQMAISGMCVCAYTCMSCRLCYMLFTATLTIVGYVVGQWVEGKGH